MTEKPFCRECLARIGDQPSREAVTALFLATLGMLLWVPAIIAIPLAHHELARIKRGEAPEAGHAFASMARGLGWFITALGAVALWLWLS
jgi:hypothetical protein